MHVDMDAFFCAVEELLNPALHGIAFAVGGAATGRGVISSASYPARKLGIHSAMPTSQALKIAPGLIVVGHRHDTYGAYSRRVMSILREYTNTLQQISVDEAWVDVTGFETAPRALALEIQKRISVEVRLPCSIGIATSKLVSKMASGRAKPAGVLQIPAGGEAAFLAPMAVGELWGVGEATAARLKQIGIATIGDLQRASPSNLSGTFGNNAAGAVARANGIDDSPVQEDGRAKSISEENTFARDLADENQLRIELLSQCDHVAARLRKVGLHAATIHLKLRWTDFTTITRQAKLAQPSQLGDELFDAVEKLWRQNWRSGQRVRLIGVGVTGLSDGEQLELLHAASRSSKRALAGVLDELRSQYGDAIVDRASLRLKPNPRTRYNTPIS